MVQCVCVCFKQTQLLWSWKVFAKGKMCFQEQNTLKQVFSKVG